jgi:hypothetical protein
MITYTVECAGFTGSQLSTVAAAQSWIDGMKARHNLKGEEVRIYKFVNGTRKGHSPDFVGRAS